MKSLHKNEWIHAIKEEHDSLLKNNTWIFTDIRKVKKILTTKWVFKRKINEAEKSIRYEARLVVKGCAQTAGIDYEETYFSVAKYSFIRFLLTLVTKENMNIDHMDVKTVYLHGDLAEEIYVMPPKEIANSKEKVWRLKKAMYGLNKAAVFRIKN